MLALDSIQIKKIISGFIFSLVYLTSPVALATEKTRLGKPASVEEIKGWDIDIRPDGKGLPVGSGNAIDGEEVFIQKCASCHGEFAEGARGFPELAGGKGTLDTHHPVKTVGSYWPYASTAFDYIRRAMPFGQAQTLTDNEVYAMTAYILFSSDIIEDDFVLDQNTLPLVKMPNRNGFIKDDRPDTPNDEPCMNDCLSKKPIITARAKQIDVTPDKEVASIPESTANLSMPDTTKGKAVFAQCAACHSVDKGENKFGPSLHGVFDKKIASVETFTNYSSALSSSNDVWSQENLRKFLKSPQIFLPGTSMPFGGISDDEQLDDLLLYMKIETAK